MDEWRFTPGETRFWNVVFILWWAGVIVAAIIGAKRR
jgi:hypothetical protein